MFDLFKLYCLKENSLLEAKKATKGLPNSIWETYSSFANSHGGTILLGVEELEDNSLIPCCLTEKKARDLQKIFGALSIIQIKLVKSS